MVLPSVSPQRPSQPSCLPTRPLPPADAPFPTWGFRCLLIAQEHLQTQTLGAPGVHSLKCKTSDPHPVPPMTPFHRIWLCLPLCNFAHAQTIFSLFPFLAHTRPITRCPASGPVPPFTAHQPLLPALLPALARGPGILTSPIRVRKSLPDPLASLILK